MKQSDSLSERRWQAAYATVLVLIAVMYLTLIGGRAVWYDESYTLAMIRHSFSEIWSITAADFHPPLYYLLLKLFSMLFGYSLLSAKFFSLIPFVLISAIGGIQLKKLFDCRTALLFMVLFAMFPCFLPFAVEIRMYSLASLFLFLNALYALRLTQGISQPSDWLMFALFGTCAAYTHYFALVSAGVVYGLLLLAVLLKKRSALKYWLFSAGLTVVLYLPWLHLFLGQLSYMAGNEYWIRPITWQTILNYGRDLLGARGIAHFSLVFGGCFLIALISLLLRKNASDLLTTLSALAVPIGTILIGVAASLLVRPVFVTRYVLPTVPLLAFFLAYAMGKMNSRILVSLLLAVALLGGILNYRTVLIGEYEPAKTGLEVYSSDNEPLPDTYVICGTNSFEEHISGVLSYYEPDSTIYVVHQPPTISPASPFPNIYPFQNDIDGPAILLFPAEEAFPEELGEDHEHRYIGTIDKYGKAANAYLLDP